MYNGNSLILDCNATGYPVPSIMWQKDSRPVDGSVNQNVTIAPNHSLVIWSISQALSGLYTCVARNDVGVAYAAVQVEIIPCELRITEGWVGEGEGGRWREDRRGRGRED